MSKKDYELIARVLRRAMPDSDHAYMLAVEFADELAATNPRFNRKRFIAACMGEDSTDSAGRKVRYSS